MYMAKKKDSVSLYHEFSSEFPKYKETELQVYIGNKVGKDISKDMYSMVRSISNRIVHSVITKEN